MTFQELLQRFAKLERRVLLTIGRGRITAADDSQAAQLLQVKLGDNEVRDQTPRVGEFGFASLPPLGSDVIVLFVAGDRSNGVVIGSASQQYRMKNLSPGEAAVYDQVGKYIWLTKDGMVIEAKDQDVTINNAKSMTVNGPTTFNGDVTINGKLIVTGQATFGDGVQVTGAVQASGEGTFNGVDVSAHVHKFMAQGGSTQLITQGPQG